MELGYLSPERMGFYVQKRSFQPKIDHPCQFQQFSSRRNFFIFKIFLDVSMRKEQQQPLIDQFRQNVARACLKDKN